MGATAIGSMEYTIARATCRTQGVDMSKIEWVATRQTSNTIQAMSAGQIDAAWIVMSIRRHRAQGASAVEDPGATPRRWRRPMPNPGGAVVVTDRYAAQNGKTIEAMVAAVIEANRALYNDRKASSTGLSTSGSPTSTAPSRRTCSTQSYRPSWGVNGGLPLGVMRSALENWKTDVNPEPRQQSAFLQGRGPDGHALRRTRRSREIGVMKDVLDTAEWMAKM